MKKSVILLYLGLCIFIIGIVVTYFEVISYDVDINLPIEFQTVAEEYNYKVNNQNKVRITNFGYDRNMKVYLDNTLNDEVRIVVAHSDTVAVKTTYKIYEKSNYNLSKVNLSSNMNLTKDDVFKIISLGIDTLKNKTVYNYNLLKYTEVTIFVSERNINNLELVSKKGTIYTPEFAFPSFCC